MTSAFGQSFNVDIGGITPGGAGAGAPAPNYGAAAQQPGYWNPIAGIDLGPFPIVNLMNDPTAIACTRTDGLGGAFGWNNGQTNGYFQNLMDDGHNAGIAGTVTYTFTGLAPGVYTVYTYAWSPFDPSARSNVTVAGSVSTNPQVVGGALAGMNTFTLGITHAIHVVTIGPAMSLAITCTGAVGAGTINGFQICGGYELTLTQAAGGFPVFVNNFRGAPGNVYANLGTTFAGAFPHGPLFGLDMTPLEALDLVGHGVPFFGTLGPNGTASFTVMGLPPGLTLYCVSVEVTPVTLQIVSVTAPFSYTIL
jgi:hypothetical protein